MTQPAAPQAPARKLNLGRLERLQRLLQYGAALVLLVFVGLIALAWTELRGIRAQIEQSERDLAERQQKLADVNAELGRKQTALDAVQSVNTVLSGVADVYKEEHPEEADKVNEAVRRAVETSIAESGGAGGGQAASLVPPRVYIQVVNAGQKPRAAEVARRLQAKGFLVPGIENVGRKGLRQPHSDVRFNPADQMAAADAEAVRAVLGDFGVRLGEVKLTGAARPREYELWLGDDFSEPAATAPRPGAGLGPFVGRSGRADANAPAPLNRKPPAEQRTPERTYPRRQSP